MTREVVAASRYCDKLVATIIAVIHIANRITIHTGNARSIALGFIRCISATPMTPNSK